MLVLRYIFWALLKFVFGLRYRVRVHGLDRVRGLKGPVLILPNHPGYVDPPLVYLSLWPTLKPRPMAFEILFKNPLLWPFAKLINAVKIPDVDAQASAQLREEAQTAVKVVIDGLKNGENFILWPSGRIQRRGVEVLGGSRALTDILKAVPEATIVLARTTGVWGSMFSFAQTGKHPELTRMLFRGLGVYLANLIFFAPRRQVDITVEKLDREKLPELTREKINPWFENWYNAGGQSEPVYVPYHFLFGPRTFDFPKPGDLEDVDLSKIKPETQEAIRHLLEDKLHRPLTDAEQTPETTLDQLGLDSLDRVDLMLHVEQQFGFSGGQVPTNLGQVWALAQGMAETATPKPPPAEWFKPINDDAPLEVQGDTVVAAFVHRALKSRREVAAADDIAGAITYERLLTGALMMAERFKKIDAPNVGVLIPASVACDVVLFGLYLAGKLPVILNWTTGPANLAHAARLTKLTHVVTSRAFIDRTGVAVEAVEYLHVE